MTKVRILFFLTLFLLCGCNAGEDGITNVPSLTAPSETGTATGRLQPRESSLHPAVAAYALPMENVYAIAPMEEDLLLFSGRDATTLTLLRGADMTLGPSLTLEGFLPPEDPSLRIYDGGMSMYLADTGEILMLDKELRILRRLSMPAELSGSPILSRNGASVYYCTENGIYVWDLAQGRHRLLKQMQFSRQSLRGLWAEDRILQCLVSDGGGEETWFLSAEDGRLLDSRPGELSVTGHRSGYYASIPDGSNRIPVYAAREGLPMALLPWENGNLLAFLPLQTAALCTSGSVQGPVALDLYDLQTGHRTARLETETSTSVSAAAGTADGNIYLLVTDSSVEAVLCRWDPASTPSGDSRTYLAPYPDPDGQDRCRAYADALSSKYGIRIRVLEDAASVQPWNYDLVPELLPHVLMAELEALDRRLSKYPGQILQDTAGHFSSLTLCLVRSITGTAESGSMDRVSGVQFLDGTDAYVVLTVGDASGGNLYHELFHVMETHIFGNSIALDQWNSLNPAGFRYDYSYLTNRTRDSGVYLLRTDPAFVDTYSMSYPKEDRARIMEYAMLPGQEALFRSPTLQRKLRAICSGIREAYDLEDREETFLWEQYLD